MMYIQAEPDEDIEDEEEEEEEEEDWTPTMDMIQDYLNA